MEFLRRFSWVLVGGLFVGSVMAAPTLEPFDIYGGRISQIRTVQLSAAESQVWATTESPNTLFSATVSHGGTSPVVSDFERVDGMLASDNRGVASDIEVYYDTSTWSTGEACVFIGVDNNVYYGKPGSWSTLSDGSVSFNANTPMVISDDGYIYLGSGSQIHWGTVASNCSVTFNTSVSTGLGSVSDIRVGPKYGAPSGTYIYVLDQSTSPATVARSDNTYGSLSGSTFTTVPASDSVYASMDVAPDGTVWMAGSKSGSKWVASTTDLTSWSEVDTGIGGVAGPVRVYDDDDGVSSTYQVFTGTARSDDAGSSWVSMCAGSFETHPNDGDNAVDSVDTNLVFFTTDQGIGKSTDGGANCTEQNDAIEAVKIQDIYVNESAAGGADAKSVAWIAAKSGIRRSSDFDGSTPSWTHAMFPNGDGSPYYSVAVNPADPLNDAWVGNVRVYATSDGGTNWSQLLAESDYSSMGGEANVNAIALDTAYTADTALYVGLERVDTDRAGGLMVRCDGGTNWEQVSLSNTVPGQDADVQDIVIVEESGSSVAYVAATHTAASTSGGPASASYGIYRITDNCSVSTSPSAWSATQQFASAKEIHTLGVRGDGVVYGAGSKTDGATAVVYENSTGSFQGVTVSGLLGANSYVGAMVVGDMPGGSCTGQVPYVAIGLKVYYLGMDSGCSSYNSSWTEYYEHLNGGAINTMFWDELVIGADTGFASLSGMLSGLSGSDDSSSGGGAAGPALLWLALAWLIGGGIVNIRWRH